MKQSIHIISPLLVVLLLSLCGCSDRETMPSLSDSAGVESFEVLKYLPENVEIAAVEINENEIKIVLAKGYQFFPITIDAEVRRSGGTAELHPTSFASFRELIFDKPSTRHTFFAVAESGRKHEYTIEIMSRNGSLIESVEAVEGVEAGIVERGVWLDLEKKKIFVYALTPSFPIEVQLKVELQNGATVVGGEPYNPEKMLGLLFETLDDLRRLEIESSSGKIELWGVQLLVPEKNVDKFSEVSTDREVRLMPNIEKSGAEVVENSDGRVMKLTRELSTQRIKIVVGGKKLVASEESPMKLAVDFKSNSGSVLIGKSALVAKEFDSEIGVVVVLDVERGEYKRWGVVVERENLVGEVGRDILGMDVVDRNDVQVEISDGVVVVGSTNFEYPLRLKVEITVSKSAHIKEIYGGVLLDDEGLIELRFSDIDQQAALVVASESGDSKTWRVKIKR